MAGGIADKAKDVASGAKDIASDAVKGASEAAKGAAEAAKSAAGTAQKAVGEKAAELSQKIDEATTRQRAEYVPAPELPEDALLIEGKVYTFAKADKYGFTEAEEFKPSSEEKTYGTLYLSGKMEHSADIEEVPVYEVSRGDVSIHYNYGNDYLAAANEEWHLAKDGGSKVDEISLKENIGNGTIILQTSVDGQTWVTEKIVADLFEETPASDDSFYEAKPLQLMNGCYYRVIVAYLLERQVDTKKVLAVNLDSNEYQKKAEVYEFFVKNLETQEESASSSNRMALGKKVETENRSGFSKEKTLEEKDPHFGWDLGSFFVSGFTGSTTDANGNPVFLKNVGDRITLWFRLEQDIMKLNDDAQLSISEDKDGYDKYFEVKKTNFGHGALIIRNTDYENVAHEPICYMDFLRANARIGADTKVVLFEEGDYEVSLDYEIKKTPRQIGKIEIVPEYYEYKITFRFSIRNGNCMVYPFDLSSGMELSDQGTTSSGFKLDMARSRYLDISVKRETFNGASDGLDVRFNRPATDGEEYQDEGIYTFTVKNKYTSEATTKTVFVGDEETVAAYKEAVK